MEWQTRVVVPIFERVCSSYRRNTHCSASPRKFYLAGKETPTIVESGGAMLLAVEQWTSASSLLGFWRGHESLTIQSRPCVDMEKAYSHGEHVEGTEAV